MAVRVIVGIVLAILTYVLMALVFNEFWSALAGIAVFFLVLFAQPGADPL